MNLLKKIFCLIGNYLPPKLNCLFYKLSGVRLKLNKVWIGNRSYLDTNFPGLISISDNVCISSEVTIICHFDPTRSIKNHPIKKYKKKVVIEENVFIGPKSVIMPGVIINGFVSIGEACLLGSGSIINIKTKIDNEVIIGSGTFIFQDVKKKTSIFNLPRQIKKNIK